jgi:hypothetical protein
LKTILIIYPHWPPSNLAGVHRPRLIGNFLVQLGWKVIVITVHERYYEEQLDGDLLRTVSPEIRVIKVKASDVLRIWKLRLIGDIGLRSFWGLYRTSKNLIEREKIDFIWIPIPSWYTSLIGRLLFERAKVPYGIDYIDPWVSKLAPYDKIFSRAWFSNNFAKILEPIAIKKASLISGVADSYFADVLKRNFPKKKPFTVAMPYGFDPHDHTLKLPNLEYPWNNNERVFIYAGAFLPQSILFVSSLFSALKYLRQDNLIDKEIKFYFIGTGKYRGKTIMEYAAEFKVDDLVVEIPERRPYLHILNYLSSANGVLIIGSTERHYTASKTFQCLLSGRPIFALLHEESSAADILKQCEADEYLVTYSQQMTKDELEQKTYQTLLSFLNPNNNWTPNLKALEPYSAKYSALKLARAIEKALA